MRSRSHFYQSTDGLRLHIRLHGELGSGKLPVICLPGLTRNARDFERLAEFLVDAAPSPRAVAAFDYRGRGLSDHDADWRNYNLAVETQDVIAGLASLGIGRAAFIGTSRGGLVLHLLAPTRRDLLAAVVLNDVGPELGPEGLIQIRDYLAQRQDPQSWLEAVAAQQAIHQAAFPALSEADWQHMAHCLYRDDGGKPALDFDPALVRTLADMDLSKPLPGLWQQFESFASIPLMVLRGENSRLLSPDTVKAMAEKHPGMKFVLVQGQGHAPILDVGDLPERIAAFLNQADD